MLACSVECPLKYFVCSVVLCCLSCCVLLFVLLCFVVCPVVFCCCTYCFFLFSDSIFKMYLLILFIPTEYC